MANTPRPPRFKYVCPECGRCGRHDQEVDSPVVFRTCPHHAPGPPAPSPLSPPEPDYYDADDIVIPGWWGWAAFAVLIALFLAAQRVFVR